MVKDIHRIAKVMEGKGYKIIVIGDKQHDEVQAISGQLTHKALVIDSLTHIPFGKIKKIRKAAVVVQSTQNIEKMAPIVSMLKSRIQELKFFNTICRPTRMKQQEIKKMPSINDVMIVIGSKASANTRRLYEISKALNKRSFRVNSKKEIKAGWFKDAKTIGITAGASTPDSSIVEIIRHLKQLK
jgi:4-hydroxy-3-methylbut-2-enyl diphosphate reductase